MRAAIQSVMLVVRIFKSLSDTGPTNCFRGLYHKLHGITRPVGMKKSTIKRRKRVVPANQEHLPDQSPHVQYPTSVSPEPSHTELNPRRPDTSTQIHPERPIDLEFRLRERAPENRYPYEPPPIDFTGYQSIRPALTTSPRPHLTTPESFSRQSDLHLHPPIALPLYNQTFSPNHTRKRSFSAAEGSSTPDITSDASRSSRLSSISALLNPTEAVPLTEDSHLDPNPHQTVTPSSEQRFKQRQETDNVKSQGPNPNPSLLSSSISSSSSSDQRSQRQYVYSAEQLEPRIRHRQEDPGGGGGGGTRLEKVGRKEWLRREAQEMRERLMATEKELEELDGEG